MKLTENEKDKLNLLLKRKGLNLSKFASQFNLTRGTLYKLINGKDGIKGNLENSDCWKARQEIERIISQPIQL